MSQYVVCNVPHCSVARHPADMTQVSVIFDGVPIKGVACSADHSDLLTRSWKAADRYIPASAGWHAGVAA